MTRYNPRPSGAGHTYVISPGAKNLAAAIMATRFGQWEDIAEHPIESVRDPDRCGDDDPGSGHCYSPHGVAALDCYFDANDDREREQGWRLATALTRVPGAQFVAFNGMRWGGDRDGNGVVDEVWREITDGDSHDSHVHGELNDEGARRLTLPQATRALRRPPSDDPEDDMPKPTIEQAEGHNAKWLVAGGRGERRHIVNNGIDEPACEVAQGHPGTKKVPVGALAPIPIRGNPPDSATPKYDPTP